jgi:hypothetical protein
MAVMAFACGLLVAPCATTDGTTLVPRESAGKRWAKRGRPTIPDTAAPVIESPRESSAALEQEHHMARGLAQRSASLRRNEICIARAVWAYFTAGDVPARTIRAGR